MLPKIGLGTWKLNGVNLKLILKEAIKLGYRLIDTAAYYENEQIIGEILQETEIDRNTLFITSKLWNTERGYDRACRALNTSLKKLKVKYLDLYLIHWPANQKQFQEAEQINRDTWRALETLHQEGKINMIGVSNFLPHHLEALLNVAKIKPMVNQIEIHPGFYPADNIHFCRQHQIVVEAWSPLGTGKILNNRYLKSLAQRHQVTSAQVALSWLMQQAIIPLPCATESGHLLENLQSPLLLTQEEIQTINQLPLQGFSGLEPDQVIF